MIILIINLCKNSFVVPENFYRMKNDYVPMKITYAFSLFSISIVTASKVCVFSLIIVKM